MTERVRPFAMFKKSSASLNTAATNTDSVMGQLPVFKPDDRVGIVVVLGAGAFSGFQCFSFAGRPAPRIPWVEANAARMGGVHLWVAAGVPGGRGDSSVHSLAVDRGQF